MKTLLSSRKCHYISRAGILLIVVALTAGMVGCAGESYALIIDSTEGGLATVPGEGIFIYDEGTVVNLMAEAEEGYCFMRWTGDVSTVADVEVATTNITMNDSCSITANFEELPEYDLTISSTSGGSVTEPGEGAFTHYEGTVVNLVAEAEDCYHFVNWTGDVGTIANVNATSTIITMSGNYSITANFEEEPVYFPDHNLEAAIRGEIGKPTGDIYCSDLAELTILYANGMSITDITGLEHATSLIDLRLMNNQISDIQALANLPNLIDLRLTDNQISNISPLANITSLVLLHLEYNQISDISALANLYDLFSIDLEYNQVSNLTALENLTSLNRLVLRHNEISDILPLVNNAGIAAGDEVHVASNPLSEDSINIYIPELVARGVCVDC